MEEGRDLLKDDGLDNGLIDPRAFPFTDVNSINTTIANDEYTQLPANNTSAGAYLDWSLPIQNNVFYDLKNSWFQFDIHVQTFQGNTTLADLVWNGSQSYANYPFPSAFHSVLRFLEVQILVNNQRLDDKCSGGFFPFKEFAKVILNTPHNEIKQWGAWNSTANLTQGVNPSTPLLANTGNYSFVGGSETLGFGNWAAYISSYLGNRLSKMTVFFQPNDGFWQVNKFVPGNVPVFIRLVLRNDTNPGGVNANYWYMSDNAAWSTSVGASEVVLNQKLWLRQIFPTNSAMNMYQRLLSSKMFSTYNVQHAETVACQIPSGQTQFSQSGLFTARKPQVIVLHFVPTANTQSSSLGPRVHPFANLPASIGGTTYPFGAPPITWTGKNQFLTATIQYGGRNYPRTWTYTRQSDTPFLGTTVQDYREYAKQCRINMNGENNTGHLPFIDDDVYQNGQLFVLVYNLQDNGETFQDRQCLENMKGSLNINIKFFDATNVPMTCFITALTNCIVTIDTQNVVAKSY